jgi:hypothetical protein
MRGVGVHDVDRAPVHDAADLQDGARVSLERRRTGYELEVGIGGALREWLVRSRGDEHRVTPMCQLDGEPEDLSLASTPATFGIDV